MDKIRWGIIGTGAMARTFAADFAYVSGAKLVAVGSRTIDAATAYAEQFSLPRVHGSYAELLDDPDVDVVYIATPHNYHRDIAIAAIKRGKPVLVEKAFTATREGAKQVVDAARAADVYCMEAMWTRFLPVIRSAREIVAWGSIGDVLCIQGDLCAFRSYNPHDRLFAPELAGGALLDLGVYPISLAQSFLGSATSVACTGRFAPNGVDMATAISLSYDGGGIASLTAGFDTHGPGRIGIYGTKGWIDIHPRFHHPSTITVHREGVLPKEITARPTGAGYAHEIEAVSEDIAMGYRESIIMPLDDTLAVMDVLQQCSDQLGLRYQEADLSDQL